LSLRVSLKFIHVIDILKRDIKKLLYLFTAKPVGLITTLRTLINNKKSTKINPVPRGSEKAVKLSVWHTNDS
jgi:hypothetical protein